MDSKSTKANQDYIERADKINEKYKKNEKDAITGKPVTSSASAAARKGAAFFRIIELHKKKPKTTEKRKDPITDSPRGE